MMQRKWNPMTDSKALVQAIMSAQFLLSATFVLASFMVDAGAATLVVDTTADVVAEDGQCSLREAIMNANGANQSGSVDCSPGTAAGNSIVFDPGLSGQTLVLNGTALPNITRALTIEGPLPNDASGLTIDGNDQVRVLYLDAGFSGSFSAALRGLTLTNGRTDALNQPGGGVWTRNVDLELEQVAITDNRTTGSSSMAGGMWIIGGKVTLTDSRIQQNQSNNSGGGIYITNGELELIRSEISGNQALGSSGGIQAENSSIVLVESLLTSNTANSIGGAMNVSNSTLELINSTVSGNHGNINTGAFYLNRSAATLINTTVAFNTTDGNTFGIMVFGLEAEPASLTLTNSLVVQAQPSQMACASSAFGTISSTNSLATHVNCTGTATTLAAINLADLEDYGGTTYTHALQAGSVALNAAGDCVSEHDVMNDQRGLPRPGGESSACDIGAYEAQEIPPASDLAVAKSVSPTQVKVGQLLTFSITASNLGPDAASAVVVSDLLPPGYLFVDANAETGSYDAGTGLWTIGDLAVDAEFSLDISVTANPSGPYLNTAVIGGANFDPDPDNNSASAEVEIMEPQADLEIALYVQPDEADIGETVSFLLVAGNLGPDTATSVAVNAALPSGYAFLTAVPEQGGYDVMTGLWTVGSLEANDSDTLTINAELVSGDYLYEVMISGDQVDPDNANNSASLAVTLPPPPPDPMLVDTVLDLVADDGFCSLREAMLNAMGNDQSGSKDCSSGNPEGSLIRFHESLIGQRIALELTLPTVNRDLVIAGPEPGNLHGITLDGDGANRILSVSSLARLELRDLTLTGGKGLSTSSGAGISAGNAELVLRGINLIDNTNDAGGGAGLFMINGSLLMVDSTVAGNVAGGQGGGIILQNSVATIRGSTISDNQSGGIGGGLYLQNSQLTMTNSTISGNSVGAGGGGALYLAGSSAELLHVTMAYNLGSSGQAHGIHLLGNENNAAALILNNSLIVQAQPVESTCNLALNQYSSITHSNSLATHSSCTGEAVDHELIGLQPLANGGPTSTHALAPDSIAIGLAENCPAVYG
jgi:uncharacterized repeat protein (TIGR01451 family)/CSLREA domain-containing protein